MKNKLLFIFFLALMFHGFGTSAQFSLFTHPPLNGGNGLPGNVAGTGVTFNLRALSSVFIDTIFIPTYGTVGNASTGQIWIGPPVTAQPSVVAPAWTEIQAGFPVTVQNSTSTAPASGFLWSPVVIPGGLLVNAGDLIGIYVGITPGAGIAYTGTTSAPAFIDTFTNGLVTIYTGIGAGWGGNLPSPNITVRQFTGGIAMRAAIGRDVRMSSLISPAGLVVGANTVTIRIQNAASDPITSVDFGYQLDNNPPITISSFALPTALSPGQTYDYTFVTPLNILNPGTYTLTTWATNANGLGADTNPANDTLVSSICTAVSGTLTVGASGATYATLGEAFSALNQCGISGPVTLSIAPGSYSGNFSLGAFAGSSAGVTITSATGNPADVVISNGGSGNTFSFVGASNITLSAVTIANPVSPTVVSSCVNISNSNGISIVNCVISANNSSTSTNNRAIYAVNSSNMIIIANTISDAYYGIYHSGLASPNYSTGNQYVNNTISNCYFFGIQLFNEEQCLVDGNRISDMQTNVSAQGIHISRARDFTVSNNQLYGSMGFYGFFATNLEMPVIPGGRNLYVNNVVSGDFQNLTPRAFHMLGSTVNGRDFVTLANNSFEVRTTSTSTTNNGAIFFTGGTVSAPAFGSVELFNNAVKVVRTGATGSNMAAVFYSGAFVVDSTTSNHNLFFFNGPTSGGVVRVVSTAYNTLADWLAASGQDSLSLNADPLFTSATDLTPLSVSPLKDQGTPLAYVTADINGTPRDPILPDIGAYEIQLVPNDLLAVDLVTPSQVITGGTPLPVTIRFKNVGTDTLTTATVAYQFANNTAITETFTGTLAPQDTATYVFTASLTIPVGVSGLLTVWTSGPNGQPDPTPANDTIRQVLCQPLAAGSYTVGGPTSDFPNFQILGQILSCGGISGPVSIQSQAPGGLMLGTLQIGDVPGTSATNRLTIEGNGDTLFFNQGPTPHVVVMDGTKHVRFRNFVLTGLGSSLTGILMNNVEDIEIIRTTVLLDTTATGTLTTGILASGSYTSSATVTSVKNVWIDSCDIMGGYYGIRYNAAATDKAENIRITNSTIRDFYLYGIWTTQDQGGLIENNLITRDQRRTISTFYGIYNSAGTAGQKVNKNIIRGANSPVSSSTTAYISYGIFYTGATGGTTEPNIVSNNLLYDIESLTGAAYGLYVSGSSGVRFYHNTVVFKNQASTVGLVYAAYFLGTGSDHELKNNILYVNRGGTGSKYCIYLASTTNLPVSNNNVLTMLSTGGTTNGIGFLGSAQPTLASWQAVNNNSFDQNSTAANPLFVDTALANFEPSNFAVDNIGANLLSQVPADLRDSARTATPDPGVYEFQVTGCFGVQNVSLDSVSHNLAAITWLSASTDWQVEYGPTGFTQGTGTLVATSARPLLITGLSPNTAYDVYVRDSCSTTLLSPWSPVFSFITERDYDLMLAAVVSPENKVCADTAVPVIIVVRNKGALAINGYSASLSTTGLTVALLSGTSTNVVQPGTTDTLILGTINLPGTGGNLNMQAIVSGNLDVYADNDTLNTVIEVNSVPIVIVQTSADTICEGGSVSLWLDTAQGVSNVVWMDSAMNVLLEGDTLVVNNLTTTTTYFVKGAGGITAQVGPADSTIGSVTAFINPSVQWLTIEALVPVKLTRAKVYVQNSGWMHISLKNTSGVEVAFDSVMVTTPTSYWPVYIDIDLDIPVGTWRLHPLTGQFGNIFRNGDGAVYPYEVPGVFKITGNSFNPVYYYYFYDMTISTGGCETALESRTIVVEPSAIAAFTLDSTALPTISVDASGSVNASSYRWNFGDGTSGTGMVASHTYTSNGNFTVQLIAEGDCGPDTTTRDITIMGVSVRDINAAGSLRLFPNPNAGLFEVNYTDAGLHRAELVVMDLQGRIVHRISVLPEAEQVRVPLKLDHLAAGMYHVQVTNNESVMRTKFKVIK